MIRNEEFSFPKVLESVNTMIGGQCRDKGLHYECRLSGQIEECYFGDDIKLRQVLINILGNAVKFTPSGGSIVFNVEETARFYGKSTLRFVIRDTGIGMNADYLPHIFDAFSQEDSSSLNTFGSTGLGMPITKSIVELMNGTIEVESEKGKGSVFTVCVTLGLSDRKTDPDGCGRDIPSELSVLIVDDDPIAREHALLVMGQIGAVCDIAEGGMEAVETVRMHHARRKDYDLILMDWKMPGMSGLEATRSIREIVGDGVPIIILTAYNWDDIEAEARTAGVDSFVSKPLFATAVMDEFAALFASKNRILLASKADLKGRRILLAEDVDINAEIMMMVRSSREMEVDHAVDGEKVVEMFADSPEGHYDAVLMDMRMPVMDGLEATRIIRGMDRSDASAVPIIALTANAFDEDVQRSMQAGLNAHLSKPVDPEALF